MLYVPGDDLWLTNRELELVQTRQSQLSNPRTY